MSDDFDVVTGAFSYSGAAIARELHRFMESAHTSHTGMVFSIIPPLLGALFSFLAGLAALRWLSSWLESGKWYLFGIYCLAASCVIFYLHHIGH